MVLRLLAYSACHTVALSEGVDVSKSLWWDNGKKIICDLSTFLSCKNSLVDLLENLKCQTEESISFRVAVSLYSHFPGSMFPCIYISMDLHFPVPVSQCQCFPGPVFQNLCFPGPISQYLCFPIPMFPWTCFPVTVLPRTYVSLVPCFTRPVYP